MYTEILGKIEDHLKATVTSEKIQVGFYANVLDVDLRRPAILIELKTDKSIPRTNAWNNTDLNITLHVFAQITTNYLESVDKIQKIISGNGDPEKVPLKKSLSMLRDSADFTDMSGPDWRFRPPAMEWSDTRFGITQRASERITAAQIDVSVLLQTAR